jgi:hypothetical protein
MSLSMQIKYQIQQNTIKVIQQKKVPFIRLCDFAFDKKNEHVDLFMERSTKWDWRALFTMLLNDITNIQMEIIENHIPLH